MRHTIRHVQSLRPTPTPRSTLFRTHKQTPQHVRFRSTDNKKDDQAYPLTGYYADILSPRKDIKDDLLSVPKEEIQPQTRTAPTPPAPESLPKTDKEEVVERARVVFGSRLAGPAERRDEIDKASQNVAGVMVPPRPQEPDNCCMSGCVNCVWDVYREDFEEWAAKSAEAREKLQAQRAGGTEADMPTHVASSMDDDGGGSEALWTEPSAGDKKDLFENVPVGIREFMRTEKMLKQRHAEEGSRGG